MATQGDQASLNSSIALLQQRFRKLQRIREMRHKRELLHEMTSEPQQQRHSFITPNVHYYQHQPSPSSFSNSEIMFQQQKRPSSQLALSLWPESQMKHADFGGLETAHGSTTKSWLLGTTLGHNNSAVKFDLHDSTSDVDTSLHL